MKKKIFLYLCLIISSIIILFILFSKNSTTEQDNYILWKGVCQNGNLQTPCDANNNCAILCNGNLIKTIKNKCSEMRALCEGENCTAECVSEIIEKPMCKNSLGIWEGSCPNFNSIVIESENGNHIVKCGRNGLPLEIPREKLTGCSTLSQQTKNSLTSICCTKRETLPFPTCSSGEVVWTKPYNKDCEFLQQKCENGRCLIYCDGEPVSPPITCNSLNLKCTGNGKEKNCIACCDGTNIQSPPICITRENEIHRTNTTCSSVQASCRNGNCKIVCDGEIIPVNSHCSELSSNCNNAGCVFCCTKK